MRARWPAILLLGFLVTGACQRGAEQPAATGATEQTNMETKDYPISGRVIVIAADKSAITLDHEDIPGLMPGMEMQFTVDDPTILEGIAAGSQVEGRLKVDGAKYIITRLETR
jgi:protein SCO1/2